VRVLVAFEDLYRSYREVIAAAIRVLRPHVEVTTTDDLEDLEALVDRLDPRVVICTHDSPAGLRPGVTWVQVSPEAASRSQFTVETLLEEIDGAESALPRSAKGARRAKPTL
jgi:hypothetical protein